MFWKSTLSTRISSRTRYFITKPRRQKIRIRFNHIYFSCDTETMCEHLKTFSEFSFLVIFLCETCSKSTYFLIIYWIMQIVKCTHFLILPSVKMFEFFHSSLSLSLSLSTAPEKLTLVFGVSKNKLHFSLTHLIQTCLLDFSTTRRYTTC